MPSPAHPSANILVTDDDSNIRALLQEVLESDGYVVDTARDGIEGLEKVAKNRPDLVLLDVEMPGMTGWDVVQKIKSDPTTQQIPVLMLTSLSQTQHRVQGLDLGADDYLTKPFNIAELLARVRSALKRTQVAVEANPLSHLPGNRSIEREINNRIQSGIKFTVLYGDLNNFKAFNDRYGFIRGDKIIQETARILLSVRTPGDFVGHVGGDDFVMVTDADRAEDICKRICAEFDRVAPAHYDEEDRKKGFIEVPDRQGNMYKFPFVGIAIAGITNAHRPLTSIGQISALGAEMKKVAKKSAKSSYAFDRRVD